MRNVTGECECCGAKTVEYRHTLSASLVRALLWFSENNTAVSLADSGLTHTQICNFQKLKYWGLVDKVEGTSLWFITDEGKAFLSGKGYARKHAWTYRGEFVRFDGEFGQLHTAIGGWKTRPEYAAEAVPHIPDER
mgnify:CR=1 FL=1